MGFSERDFDAYAPQKWKSNFFTRERLDVKQKLVTLGKLLSGGMLSADGSPLAHEASAEYPALWNHKQVEAQHVYFFRNEGARRELDAIMERQKPLAELIGDPSQQKNHVYLVLTVSHAAFLVALELHADADVDRRNLERKTEDFFEREKLLGLLRALPDDYRVGFLAPGAPRMPQAADGTLSEAAMRPTRDLDDAALGELLARLTSSKDTFYLGRLFPRGDVRLASSDFADIVRGSLTDLLPFYRYAAWTRDNDFVSMREVLRQEKQAKRQKHLVKHDRVRIVRGMFAGKQGVVQELDAKGILKVLIGKMAVKIDAEDVVKA